FADSGPSAAGVSDAARRETREEGVGLGAVDLADAERPPGPGDEQHAAAPLHRRDDAGEDEIERQAEGDDREAGAEERRGRRAHAVDERRDADIAPDGEGEETGVERDAREAHLAPGLRQAGARDDHVAVAEGPAEELDPPLDAYAAVLRHRELGGLLVREGDPAEEARGVDDEEDAAEAEERRR